MNKVKHRHLVNHLSIGPIKSVTNILLPLGINYQE